MSIEKLYLQRIKDSYDRRLLEVEEPLIGMMSLAFRNPKAIKKLYEFHSCFFAIEEIEDYTHIVCLPIDCKEDYITGKIDEVPAIDVTNDNIKAFKDALLTLTD